ALERGLVILRTKLAHQLPHRPAYLDRATERIAVPERDSAGLARRRRDQHLGRGDVGDPPGGGAQHEGVARAALVDHFFVQLADAAAVLKEVDGVEPAVRNRPTAGNCQALGTGPAANGSLQPVPDDAGPEFRELVRGIAAAEPVEAR